MSENFLEDLEINTLFSDESNIEILHDAAYSSYLAVQKQIGILETNAAFYKKVAILTGALLKKKKAAKKFMNR
jgi:hypothetical protein